MTCHVIRSTSSGFVISGRRILTNAHSTVHHTSVCVKKHGNPKKFNATVWDHPLSCKIGSIIYKWHHVNCLGFGRGTWMWHCFVNCEGWFLLGRLDPDGIGRYPRKKISLWLWNHGFLSPLFFSIASTRFRYGDWISNGWRQH
jgi:hypothetical protein